MENKAAKKKFSVLALKFILGFLLLGILICVTSSCIGYFQYKRVIEQQYNDTAYQIADMAGTFVSSEEVKRYFTLAEGYIAGTVTKDTIEAEIATDRYQEIVTEIKNLRESMGANDVYIFRMDVDVARAYSGTKEGWYPLLYAFDSYTKPELNYVLGDRAAFNPDYIADAVNVVETGKRSKNKFVSKGDYGYNTTALLPLVENGEVYAVVGAEIPMSTVQSALREYLIYAVVITIALVIAFILLYMVYLFKRVIKPINVVAKEASSFTESGNVVSEALSKIKTRDEIQLLAENIRKMETDINDYIANLTAVTAEKERIGAELSVATHIQKSMLPCIFPAFPERDEFDIFASMEPAKEVGGDFYDMFLIDKDNLAVVIADVSGKGVPAALFMVIAKTLIKNHAQNGETAAEVFNAVNAQLCENNAEGMFVTAWLGIYNIPTGKFTYVNAGHNPPLLKRKDGQFEYLKGRSGFVLAGMEGINYKQQEMTLDAGDTLYLYTDGVTEATDASDELYGEERLKTVLDENCDMTVSDLLPAVKQDIDKFVGDAPQFDDITMLALKISLKEEKKHEKN